MKKRIAVMLCAMMIGCTPLTAFAAEATDSNDIKTTVTETRDNKDTEANAEDSDKNKDTVTEEDVQEQINVTTDEDGKVTFSFGDWEWSSEDADSSEETSGKTGTVKGVDSYLHLRNGAGLDYDIIGHLFPGAEVKVVGEDGDWYQVVVPEQSGYVSKDYLSVTENISSSEEVDEDMLAMLLYLMMLSGTDENNTSPLTPDGNLTLVDDIGSSTEAGQQFLTFVTKSGNTFYMIIDRNDKGEENVHFLNLVDEADLLALMEEEDVSKYQTVETVETETTETEEEEPTEPEKEEEEKTEKKSMAVPLILLFLAGIGGVGGFLYLKLNDKKKPVTDQVDPDADYQDDDDDAYDIPDEEEDIEVDEYPLDDEVEEED